MIILGTSSFKDFDRVCKALGLSRKESKYGHIWKGMSPLNNRYVKIPVHMHADGRDLSTGVFNSNIKELGFKNVLEYKQYLNQI